MSLSQILIAFSLVSLGQIAFAEDDDPCNVTRMEFTGFLRNDTAIYGPDIIGSNAIGQPRRLTEETARRYTYQLLKSLPENMNPDNSIKKGYLVYFVHGPNPDAGRHLAWQIASNESEDYRAVIFISCAGKHGQQDLGTHRNFAAELQALREAGLTGKRIPAIGFVTPNDHGLTNLDTGNGLVTLTTNPPKLFSSMKTIEHEWFDNVESPSRQIMVEMEERHVIDSSRSWEVSYDGDTHKTLNSERFFGANPNSNFEYKSRPDSSPGTKKCDGIDCSSPRIREGVKNTCRTFNKLGKAGRMIGNPLTLPLTVVKEIAIDGTRGMRDLEAKYLVAYRDHNSKAIRARIQQLSASWGIEINDSNFKSKWEAFSSGGGLENMATAPLQNCFERYHKTDPARYLDVYGISPLSADQLMGP